MCQYRHRLCLQNLLRITTKQTCFCLCVNSLCEQSTVHRDMHSHFILSACAVSDFPHFAGHPAVQRHCTCTPQLVFKRFPESQNISSAVQCAPPYAEKMVWRIRLCWQPCGLAHHCHCAGVVLKINGCMLTRFDMLYKGSHLWSHDTAKQKTQQASLAKMSDMNKSTTICHIAVTKC